MFLDGLLNADSLPTLERASQFAARRQDIIAHNITNVSTPNFQPTDVSVSDFRQSLGEAIDKRRSRFDGVRGELGLRSSREVKVGADGNLALEPSTFGKGVLFHDRNNRDLERLMQDLVENLTAFRVASDLLKSRMQLLRSAIAGRI